MPRTCDLDLTRSSRAGDRPFPRPCPECGKVEVQLETIAYDAEIKHDGRLYTFRIPELQINKCGVCGEVLFDTVTDDQISQALREHLNLLSPQHIREGLKALGLKQKEFGEQIGVAPETISRWLSGTHIQSRAMDTLMRLFFEFDNVRFTLAASGPDRNLGVIGRQTSSAEDFGAVMLITGPCGKLRPMKTPQPVRFSAVSGVAETPRTPVLRDPATTACVITQQINTTTLTKENLWGKNLETEWYVQGQEFDATQAETNLATAA